MLRSRVWGMMLRLFGEGPAHTCGDEVPLVLRVPEAAEQPSVDAQAGGVPLAECGPHGGADVDHRPLRPHRQAGAYRAGAGRELDQQRA